jgi:hypothetical protein
VSMGHRPPTTQKGAEMYFTVIGETQSNSFQLDYRRLIIKCCRETDELGLEWKMDRPNGRISENASFLINEGSSLDDPRIFGTRHPKFRI